MVYIHRHDFCMLLPQAVFAGARKKRPGQLLAHARRSHKNMGIRARLYIVRLHINSLGPKFTRVLAAFIKFILRFRAASSA